MHIEISSDKPTAVTCVEASLSSLDSSLQYDPKREGWATMGRGREEGKIFT